MPNLSHIQSLHKRYKPESQFAKLGDLSATLLKESINPDRLEKAFLTLSSRLGIDFETYFEFGLDAAVALLYIDICSFSSRYAQLAPENLSDFLDEYYDLIIPIIYEYGGEVDRIMGDGIVAIFGPPFLDGDLYKGIYKAFCCALHVTGLTNNTKFFSKVALHAGSIRYYRNKSSYYPEYTIIGKPITELYRLESVAEDRTVTYYGKSAVDKLIEKIRLERPNVLTSKGLLSFIGPVTLKTPLKGVNYSSTKSIIRQ